jgi:2-polyprenyl-3-methyl-5-hydroxy-6-metoxy-1,4-benzoquinol methylase
VAAGYVRGKLRHDPVYRQLVERAPLPAPLLDVGCGRGQTIVLLALAQPGLAACGLDWDEPKLAVARAAARDLPHVRFASADVRDAVLPPSGTVLLLDVLHYQTPSAQDVLLARAAAAVLPGGVLFVREIDGAAGWRARLTTWQERLGCWLGVNRGAGMHVRPADELAAKLEAAGLRTTRVASAAGALANVLLEARRA